MARAVSLAGKLRQLAGQARRSSTLAAAAGHVSVAEDLAAVGQHLDACAEDVARADAAAARRLEGQSALEGLGSR